MKSLVEKTMNKLKDFQLATVDYALHSFQKGNNRFLIADEVGLGKTIVARGIVARLYEQAVLKNKQASFRVIYVCSNQAIAKANINKLNFTEDPNSVITSARNDRLTSLAYEDTEAQSATLFSIRAFTPATSFEEKSHSGRKDERILLYRLLATDDALSSNRASLKWILKTKNVSDNDAWSRNIDEAAKQGTTGLRPQICRKFRSVLQEIADRDQLPKCYNELELNHEVKYWTLLRKLCELDIRKKSTRQHNFDHELISHLRFKLSQACLELLNADIFILDEFQRYKKLIDSNEEDTSPAAAFTRAIFSYEKSKVLMLSATPFKAYTNDFDEMNGEIHHKEFDTVLRFLKPGISNKAWKIFERWRSETFAILRHSMQSDDERNRAVDLKQELEIFYRACMVRTERLVVAQDKDTMIKSAMDGFLVPDVRDVEDFLALDQITQYLNENHKSRLPIPLEYVKSSPFALSFLDGYQHRKLLMSALSDDENLAKMLRKLKHSCLDLDLVRQYQPLSRPMPNAKLRLLLEQTIDNDGWKMLWVPPTMPYYAHGKPFSQSTHFSKVLVFSSWLLVPRMISTIVSYEAERRSVGNHHSISKREQREGETKRAYFQERRQPRPQILFRTDKNAPQNPINFAYLYPCIALAELYDPQRNLVENESLSHLKARLKKTILTLLNSEKIQSYAVAGGDTQAWYWYAPLLLDSTSNKSSIVESWLSRDSSDLDIEDSVSGGIQQYFQSFKTYFKDPKSHMLGRLNSVQMDNVAEFMVSLMLGSPAICYLRTQTRSTGVSQESLENAFDVASGFISLFNKPESIATIRLCTAKMDSGTYLEHVLEYSIAGNMQALLDEYHYLVREQESLGHEREIAAHISDVLTIRSSSLDVDDVKSLIRKGDVCEIPIESKRNKMRTYYAMDFSGQKLSTGKSTDRTINVRQAFNSPFRPFVLATTSIGQEGLDFHLYCRKIFHWNLPHNAIDIEQREGRINRFKGLVIRQNLFEKYKSIIRISTTGLSAWDELFRLAAEQGKEGGLCEMVPFWHIEPKDHLKIERFVPLYSFSRDIEKYSELRKILAYYRLTFGQPRQEELVHALSKNFESHDLEAIKNLIIDLSPISFTKRI